MTSKKILISEKLNCYQLLKGEEMSQGIIITLIICGTVLVLSLAGMVFVAYIIKKGMKFGEKEREEK